MVPVLFYSGTFSSKMGQWLPDAIKTRKKLAYLLFFLYNRECCHERDEAKVADTPAPLPSPGGDFGGEVHFQNGREGGGKDGKTKDSHSVESLRSPHFGPICGKNRGYRQADRRQCFLRSRFRRKNRFIRFCARFTNTKILVSNSKCALINVSLTS